MSDFGVSKALPKLSKHKADEIVDFIKNSLGAANQNELSLLREQDFYNQNILTKIQCRRLFKYWKTGWY